MVVKEEKDIIKMMTSQEFRDVCHEYGVDWDSFYFTGDGIVLSPPKKDIFVFLDFDFNTIGISHVDEWQKNMNINQLSDIYNSLFDSISPENGVILPSPFQDLSLKQLMDLAKRVNLHDTNHGHSFDMIVNEKRLSDSHDSDYVTLLGYIKFLSEVVHDYWLNAYRTKIVGSTVGHQGMDVYTYLKGYVANIEECVDTCLKEKRKPLPIDISGYLGMDNGKAYKRSNELYLTIDTLLKARGIKAKKLNELHNTGVEPALNEKAVKLLKILNVSSEEIEKRADKTWETFTREEGNLTKWLEEKPKKEKGNKELTKAKKPEDKKN